jgi:hypothetical protein
VTLFFAPPRKKVRRLCSFREQRVESRLIKTSGRY